MKAFWGKIWGTVYQAIKWHTVSQFRHHIEKGHNEENPVNWKNKNIYTYYYDIPQFVNITNLTQNLII